MMGKKNKEKVVKINKKLLNEILHYISEDNLKYGLIFKLLYVYGRSINEVLRLKVSDIDNNSIEFELPTERFNFILYEGLKKPLREYIENKKLTANDYIFIDDEKNINKYSKNLNYYLQMKITELNKTTLSEKCPILVNSDLRNLRGQHLFLDGASVKIVNELYRNKNIQTTKNHIKYNELLKYKNKINSLEKIFKKHTDLRVFHDSSFDNSDMFMVCDDGCDDEVIFELDYGQNIVHWMDKENPMLLEVFEKKCVKCEDLKKLEVGDYLLYGDLKIIKN